MQPDALSHPVAPPPERRWYGSVIAGDLAALWPAIVVAFLAVLAVAFGMSFHGLFKFGELIMGWALGLCIAAPIGLDVFSLLSLIATFLTRDARLRVRAYCWGFLIGTVALSIAGNGVSAYAILDAVAARRGEEFTWGYAQVSAIVGAAFWPLLSAIALHLLIVVRRHLDERRDKERQDAAAAERAALEVERLAEVERGLEARAVVLAAGGTTVSEILDELDLEESQRRNVERWTKPVRDALTGRPATPKTPTRVNGRRVAEKTDAGTVPASR